MQDSNAADWIQVTDLDTLRNKKIVVVTAGRNRIAVIADGTRVAAVDNRCPHMGFPLDRGSIADGILTCHWHQARFDLASGCTFDPFADDIPAYDTRVEANTVWVSSRPRRELTPELHMARLRSGMEQDVPLVQAKSLLGLLDAGQFDGIVVEAAEYAARNLPRFSEGLVRLTCIANLQRYLAPETAFQALLFAVRRIASEATSAIPHRSGKPLAADVHDLPTLRRWLRQWVQTRHADAVERTLLTALEHHGIAGLSDLLMDASAERLFADTGHLFDFANKMLELAEHLGKDATAQLLPLMTVPLASVRGEEESTAWHHPIDLVEPLRTIERELPKLLASPRRGNWTGEAELIAVLLGEDPIAILQTLRTALVDGARAEGLAACVAYCAACRMARFAPSNEVADWLSVQHTLNFTAAVHRAAQRVPDSPHVTRAIFQGAVAVYMDRHLNIPPARLPSDGCALEHLPAERGELLKLLLETLDQRSELDAIGRIVARYFRLGYQLDELVDTLTLATVREDLDFHTLQSLDAGVRLCEAWKDSARVEHIMIGVARGLAAQCPTRRAGQQTALTARRLHRGDVIYDEDEAG